MPLTQILKLLRNWRFRLTHQAQAYINDTVVPNLPSNVAIQDYALSQTEATHLLKYLNSDAISYIYSAIVSIGDANVSLKQGLFTWSTVKLYYATFYAIRAFLALDNICIFYVKTKPYAIKVNPGSSPQKREGQTHKIILKEFRNRNPEHFLLSQEIDFEDPLIWLMNKREEANYKAAKFCEPDIPKHFQQIIKFSLRKAIKEYLLDSSSLYTFDADHAILAYPLKTIQLVYEKTLTTNNFCFKNDEIKYLRKLFRDKNGPIPEIYNLFKN
jgi:hypothetical protein